MDLTAKNHNFDDFGWVYIYIYIDRPWHGIGYLILDRPTHTSIHRQIHPTCLPLTSNNGKLSSLPGRPEVMKYVRTVL